MTQDRPFHLETNAREFTFEQSSYYKPLWYRREVVLADGPDDFTELCPCQGVPGGLHFRTRWARSDGWRGPGAAKTG